MCTSHVCVKSHTESYNAHGSQDFVIFMVIFIKQWNAQYTRYRTLKPTAG